MPPCLAEWHVTNTTPRADQTGLPIGFILKIKRSESAPILSTQRGVLLSQRPRAG